MKRVLVANRGEIASRVIDACAAEGLEAVAVYSTADRDMPYLERCASSVCIGPPDARNSYLNADALLHSALGTGCDAVHPGYGFLAENAAFARRCAEHGLVFVGPSPEAISLMGDKIAGRDAALEHGVPVVPGASVDLTDLAAAAARAETVGYPLLIKASGGGGGRGMRIVNEPRELAGQLAQASAEAAAAFANPEVYLERFFERVHHVEVQVFGDDHGHALHLGERDCSVQRRHQKLVEETPSTLLGGDVREAMFDAAVRLTQAIGYQSAGTVEFIYEPDSAQFYFIEMNTRIQVEHPVTEMVADFDLVREQLRVAGGEPLSLTKAPERQGHAIEWRLNAEDPERGFAPCPGHIQRFLVPKGPGIRVDTFVAGAHHMSPHYDSLFAKLIVHGRDRSEALARSEAALAAFVVEGISTTIGYHRRLLAHPDFRAGRVHTRWIEEQGKVLGS